MERADQYVSRHLGSVATVSPLSSARRCGSGRNMTSSSAAHVLVSLRMTSRLADEIMRPLKSHFDQLDRSTNPDLANSDFDTYKPDALVLGFKGLEKSFRYYLGLYQSGSATASASRNPSVQ